MTLLRIIGGIIGFLLLIPLLLIGRLLGIGRREDMVFLKDDHPEMEQAKKDARNSLDGFVAKLRAPGPDEKNFAIKAAFKVEDGSEHIWVGNLEYQDGKFSGKLDNHPNQITHLKLGDAVTVAVDDVSDWAYALGDVYQGHYTTRVLMRHTSAKMRKKIAAVYGWADEGQSA